MSVHISGLNTQLQFDSSVALAYGTTAAASTTTATHGALSFDRPLGSTPPLVSWFSQQRISIDVSAAPALTLPVVLSGDGAGTYSLPVPEAQALTTGKNTALPITLTVTGGTTPDATAYITSSPSHGALTGTAPALTYTPSTGFVGQDSFTFYIDNGDVNSISVTVTIDVTELPGQWQVNRIDLRITEEESQ
jgi:hypothetical protein